MSAADISALTESLRRELDAAIGQVSRVMGDLQAAGEKPMVELVDALERAGAEIPPLLRMMAASQ